MGAFFSLLYGMVVYVFFLSTFLYAVGFVGNLWVPKSIDTGAQAPLGEALIVNLHLLALFAVQHSVMARKSFKLWWTRIVPPAVERSTYVLAATLALALLLWQWRPIAEPVIWNVDSAAGAQLLWAVFWLGWALLLLSTFLINHFELFGLRQVFSRLAGREIPESEFRTPFVYRYVRHPIYLGFLMGFWAAPVMTAGAPVLRHRHHRLHPGRHLVRGARPGCAIRRAVPALPQPGRHAAAEPQGTISMHAAA